MVRQCKNLVRLDVAWLDLSPRALDCLMKHTTNLVELNLSGQERRLNDSRASWMAVGLGEKKGRNQETGEKDKKEMKCTLPQPCARRHGQSSR